MEERSPGSPFHFTWHVDQLGYDLVEEPAAKPGKSILTSKIPGWHLVRKGGPLREYWPLEDHPALFRQFADLSTEPEGLQEFANRYGLLGWSPHVEPPVESEDCNLWREHVQSFRGGIELIDSGRRSEAIRGLNEVRNPWMGIWIDDGPGVKKPTMRIVPKTLIGAMRLQFAGEITEEMEFRKCRACPKWFVIGPGLGYTPARNTRRKIFCSDRCRVAWNRHKRRAGAAPD